MSILFPKGRSIPKGRSFYSRREGAFIPEGKELLFPKGINLIAGDNVPGSRHQRVRPCKGRTSTSRKDLTMSQTLTGYWLILFSQPKIADPLSPLKSNRNS